MLKGIKKGVAACNFETRLVRLLKYTGPGHLLTFLEVTAQLPWAWPSFFFLFFLRHDKQYASAATPLLLSGAADALVVSALPAARGRRHSNHARVEFI